MGRNICATVAVLYCTIALVLADTKHNNVSYFPASWMKDLEDIIYDKTLLEITLPGSHDSGAYEFSDELSPLDPKIVDDLIYLGTKVGLDIYGFIKNWSITQNTTIYEQLQGGIRYLDLRACELKGDWYTQHFLVGTRTQDLLNDIQKFMQESTGEVIVVELGQLVPVTDELSLIHMFQNTLGKYLAPQMNLNVTTIREMVKHNHRIVVLYPGDSPYLKNFTFLWDKDNFVEGSYANMDKLDNMVNWNIKELNLYGGVGKFFELSWTLTTQDSDIIKTLLDPFLRVRTLKEMAMEADGYLASFAYQYNNFMLGNILLVDFWEASGVVELVISRNLRNCHDDPKLIATDPSGLYCRSFFEEGVCTNPRYSEWMQSHCKLSCGVC